MDSMAFNFNRCPMKTFSLQLLVKFFPSARTYPQLFYPDEELSDAEKNRNRVTRRVIVNRILLIGSLFAVFIVCLSCRVGLNMPAHFGRYCLYPNGTFQHIPPEPAIPLDNSTFPGPHLLPGNCTIFYP